MRTITLVFIFFLLVPFPLYAADWVNDAGNPQRTGYTSEEPVLPWNFQWTFNGPDSNGGAGQHMYDAPREARTITGGGKVFVPAGTKGLYALNLSNGQIVWNFTTTSFLAAPIYEVSTQMVYAGGSDGKVYKIRASDGVLIATYTAGSQIRKSLLLHNNFIYVVTDGGQLHKINASMQHVWTYASNSKADTPPALSTSKDIIIFATNDLFIHAVNNSSGTQKWKVKPSPNSPGVNRQITVGGTYLGNQFDRGWPVISEKHGIVLLRMQLDHQAHYEGPNGGRFASTNAENRTWLQANPQWKNLFALNLDNGTEKFIPAVGYGSTEDYAGDTLGVMGSQPAIRTLPDGNEVAYIPFRNIQGRDTDYRWSGHLGEMVLDNSTVPGLVAGDLRFIDAESTEVHIIDEQNPITLAGNSIFLNHWAAMTGLKIIDRSASKGLTFTSPITTTTYPPVMRAMKACGSFSSNHYSTCSGVNYTTDGGSSMNGRGFSGPAFYSYWNIPDPPGWRVGSGNTSGTSYSSGFQPRYAYVTNGYIVIEGNGGDLFVLKHSGDVSNPTNTLTISPTLTIKQGDGNGDGNINGLDYIVWLTNFGTHPTTGANKGDYNLDGNVNGLDYIVWLTHFGT